MGETIGNTDPICPYCSKTLDKMPSRKKKCPYCGNFMYVRTRPYDRQRVLVTERGVQDIDEQWNAIHGEQRVMRFVDEAEFNMEKKVLSARFGREPSDLDVLWSLHNKHLTEYARMNNWGLYRNTRLAMAELLVMEGKLRQALDTFLEISYLNTNGPNNLGETSDPILRRQFPPFSTDSAFVAPGIVAEIDMLAEKLSLANSDIRDAFLAVAQRVSKNLKLPVAPEEGWRRLMEDRKPD